MKRDHTTTLDVLRQELLATVRNLFATRLSVSHGQHGAIARGFCRQAIARVRALNAVRGRRL